MSVVEAKFHLLQIEEKVAPPDSIIAPEFRFGERPKGLDAVDMVAFSRELAAPMINPVMPVAVGKKAVVASERIGVDRAALGDFLLDNKTEDGAGDVRNGTGINPAVALKKPENTYFSGRASAAVAFAMAAEIGLVDLDFSGEDGLALAFLRDGTADKIIDPLGAVAVDSDLPRGASCRQFESEVADELAHFPVREPAAFDKFLSHELIIQRSNI
jgi:hypothetical protein